MEGFKQEKNVNPERAETREEKIRNAEIIVKRMFDQKMETPSIIRNIQEKPSFDGSEERDL